MLNWMLVAGIPFRASEVCIIVLVILLPKFAFIFHCGRNSVNLTRIVQYLSNQPSERRDPFKTSKPRMWYGEGEKKNKKNGALPVRNSTKCKHKPRQHESQQRIPTRKWHPAKEARRQWSSVLSCNKNIIIISISININMQSTLW